jgi:hypothetical protein
MRTQLEHLLDPSIMMQRRWGFAYQQRSQGMAISKPSRSIFVAKARRSRFRSRELLLSESAMAKDDEA